MQSFGGKYAVVTGGGTGMGRELVRQLAREGCHVAACDIDADTLAETRALALDEAPDGTQVTTFVADVADEAAMTAFRTHVESASDGWAATASLNLLFNNAGIGGGGSFVIDDRADWERTYNICWGGVYLGCRVFVPMMLDAAEGHVVNTSSVNGFWASLGPDVSHTAYAAAKFAVKGFTEALITDFRLNAPHLKASVVMPGHIGTSIALNSGRILGRDPKELTDEQVAQLRARLERRGMDLSGASDDDIRLGVLAQAESFRDDAPMTAAEAAAVILDGVREERWRILVGDDAHILDQAVRAEPEQAYERSFIERVREQGAFGFTQG